jgi:hypothetical protein
MRPILLASTLIFVASSSLHATEALLFDGGGYNIQILIGYEDHPVIAQVLFTPPGATNWISLPRSLLRIEKFDMKKRILVMRFSNQNNPDLLRSFSLSIKKNDAVLSISGKQIKSSFDWTM